MNPSNGERASADATSDVTALATRRGLPPAATWLRDRFPAEGWSRHANYHGLAAFWQRVHQGIRSEAAELRSLTERHRDAPGDEAVFQRLYLERSRQYLGHLQFHHEIEDGSYFPKFRALDARLAAGFDLLERDHQAIHHALVGVVDAGDRLVGVLRGPKDALRRELDANLDAAASLSRLLDRHLSDEEDLVIPAILAHGDRSLGA